MGAVKGLWIELTCRLDDGDESARQGLVQLGALEALRGLGPLFDVLYDYADRGLSIVPQLPGAKCPCVRWKPYQEYRPHVSELLAWYQNWPDAGIAVVLGPVSDLFAVDVDGPEAHQALLKHLGKIPAAPKSISGSGKPWRYHLFFRHPAIPTRAKATPLHPSLEFRGHGGIVVLPPSLHKSGNQYRWATGQSFEDLLPPDVPPRILETLTQQQRRHPVAVTAADVNLSSGIVKSIPGISRNTKAFLQGQFAEGPNWNTRLFRAACDLAGNNVTVEKATPLLLAGAKPRNNSETHRALETIRSAFAQPRIPARRFARQTKVPTSVIRIRFNG